LSAAFLSSLIGGVIGYAKAKSVPSLIAGAVSGGISLACASQVQSGNRLALLVAAVLAAVLGLRFVFSWRAKHRLMPDLLMIVFSLAVLLAAASALA
jgi:uncharacterized membrane protein (UPF0136 family)